MLAHSEWKAAGEQLENQPVAGEQAALNQYAHLVRRVVAHMRSQVGVVADRDDLQQIGMMALLKSIRRYGRSLDEQFESYAFKSIRGAMLDEFRRLDWRSRQSRKEAHDFRDAVRELRRELGREPRDAEICVALKISERQLLNMRYLEQAEVVESFEMLLEQQTHFVDSNEDIEQLEVRQLMTQTLALLPERHRILLQLYYTHELNMKEIALTLGLTESRVCQLHKQSLQLLTEKLKG